MQGRRAHYRTQTPLENIPAILRSLTQYQRSFLASPVDSQHTTDHGQMFSLPSQFDSTQIADQITMVVLYAKITTMFLECVGEMLTEFFTPFLLFF